MSRRENPRAKRHFLECKGIEVIRSDLSGVADLKSITGLPLLAPSHASLADNIERPVYGFVHMTRRPTCHLAFDQISPLLWRRGLEARKDASFCTITTRKDAVYTSLHLHVVPSTHATKECFISTSSHSSTKNTYFITAFSNSP